MAGHWAAREGDQTRCGAASPTCVMVCTCLHLHLHRLQRVHLQAFPAFPALPAPSCPSLVLVMIIIYVMRNLALFVSLDHLQPPFL